VLGTSDPEVSEWGNPSVVIPDTDAVMARRAPGELKHLMYPEEKRGFP
jgi:hypothetical protein